MTTTASTDTKGQDSPKTNDQILFDRPNCLFVGLITKVTDKAVACMYGLLPISVHSSNTHIEYTHECWIPKSVLIKDGDYTWTVKKWFSINFKGGKKMRRGTFIATSNR